MMKKSKALLTEAFPRAIAQITGTSDADLRAALALSEASLTEAFTSLPFPENN